MSYHYAIEIDSRIGDEELSAKSNIPVWQPLYVKKRPFVEEFLKEVCKHFEVVSGLSARSYPAFLNCIAQVIFTASLQHYADSVIDGLLPEGVQIDLRLYRESCTYHEGAYVKVAQ